MMKEPVKGFSFISHAGIGYIVGSNDAIVYEVTRRNDGILSIQYANIHIVFIWILYMLKLNIGIFVCNELKSEIFNGF